MNLEEKTQNFRSLDFRANLPSPILFVRWSSIDRSEAFSMDFLNLYFGKQLDFFFSILFDFGHYFSLYQFIFKQIDFEAKIPIFVLETIKTN